jgi:hypothetical protein
MPPDAAIGTSAEVARDCLAWLDAQDFGCAPASRGDEGTGIAVLQAQISGQSFLIECRARWVVHPSRPHVRRLARYQHHGSRVLSVRSARELEDQLRVHFAI